MIQKKKSVLGAEDDDGPPSTPNSSHIMHLLKSFKKSTSMQNRQLIVYFY